MLKNITFTVPVETIEKARELAKRERTSLNQLFQSWLESYAGRVNRSKRYERLMMKLKYVNAGRRFSRDEMNER